LRLTDLVDDEGGLIGHGGDVEVTGLASDSRKVRPGYLFAALSGTVTDGSRFVADAVSRGAVAILASPELSLTGVPGADDVGLVRNDNPRRGLARMAARFHGAQPAVIAAVTGTNGKTSVAWFTRQIWTHLGHKAVSLGTLGITGPGMSSKGGMATWPGSPRPGSSTWCSKPPATASPSTGSTGSRLAPAPSQICRAIISTTTARWTTTAAPS